MSSSWTAAKVAREVLDERNAQDAKWGEQNHPDGTGNAQDKTNAAFARQICDQAFEMGFGTWSYILAEEVYEAFAESDPIKLREELIQVAAVAVAWVEAIDRRAIDPTCERTDHLTSSCNHESDAA